MSHAAGVTTMRSRSAVVSLFVLLLPSTSAFAQTPAQGSGDRECNQCSDLCYLVDLYWQKSRGIKVWEQYAASTLPSKRTALPAKVTDLSTFEDFIYGEEMPKAWSQGGGTKGVGCVVCRHRGRRGSQKPQRTFILQPVS